MGIRHVGTSVVAVKKRARPEGTGQKERFVSWVDQCDKRMGKMYLKEGEGPKKKTNFSLGNQN